MDSSSLPSSSRTRKTSVRSWPRILSSAVRMTTASDVVRSATMRSASAKRRSRLMRVTGSDAPDSCGSQDEPSLLGELALHESEEPPVVRGRVPDLLRVVQQKGAGVRIKLLLGQEILREDAPDDLSGTGLVPDFAELSADQPLDHGLRDPPGDLLSARHDPDGQRTRTGGRVSRELSGKLAKNSAAQTGRSSRNLEPL